MQSEILRAATRDTRRVIVAALGLGVLIGALGGTVFAAASAPSEHKGLKVEALGIISPGSMQATIGLTGRKLQLRAITIAPGGQIAKHSHASRPGLVKVVDGEWVEGRESGEEIFAANSNKSIVEDENTTHWFFNRGNTPATAIVCDVVPDK